MTFRNTEECIFHWRDQTVCIFKPSLLLTANAGIDALPAILNNWTSFFCVVLGAVQFLLCLISAGLQNHNTSGVGFPWSKKCAAKTNRYRQSPDSWLM